MDDEWFTPLADELAQCLLDARACATACEELLAEAQERLDPDAQRRLLSAVVAAAAVSRVLVEALNRPRQLVLAAAEVCRDTTLQAAETLQELALPLDSAAAIEALRRTSASAGAFVEAARRR